MRVYVLTKNVTVALIVIKFSSMRWADQINSKWATVGRLATWHSLHMIPYHSKRYFHVLPSAYTLPTHMHTLTQTQVSHILTSQHTNILFFLSLLGLSEEGEMVIPIGAGCDFQSNWSWTNWSAKNCVILLHTSSVMSILCWQFHALWQQNLHGFVVYFKIKWHSATGFSGTNC